MTVLQKLYPLKTTIFSMLCCDIHLLLGGGRQPLDLTFDLHHGVGHVDGGVTFVRGGLAV
jgi:hypothetical protein